MLMPYFGKWPEWFNLYLESCKRNPTIDWLFFTDCGEPENRCPNVAYVKTSFPEYRQLISSSLGINFTGDPYKLCDIKPAYGVIGKQYLSGYDYYGWGDIDVIYGNIRKFYTNDILRYNIISTHYNKISGHFCLFKNTEMNKNAFRRINGWQSMMENPVHLSIDESKLSKIYLRHKKYPPILRKLMGIFDKYQSACCFAERYSTIFSGIPWIDGSFNFPDEWYWQNGRLTDNLDHGKEFLYLHFMNWQSGKWLPKEKRGTKSAWEQLDKIVHLDYKEAPKGWKINKYGFYKI